MIPAFGELICRTMDNWHGQKLSLRQSRTRTGIDTDTLSRMRNGEVPRVDKVIAFAQGFELDPNDLLELAGYGRLDRSAPEAIVLRGVAEVAAEFPNLYIPAPGLEQIAGLSVDGARKLVEAYRESARAGDFPLVNEDSEADSALGEDAQA